MTRQRLATLLASTLAAVTALTLGGLPSGASAQTDSTPHSKRVCAHAATGFAACDAHVRTDGNLKPLATTTYQSGYSPTQLRKAYGLNADRPARSSRSSTPTPTRTRRPTSRPTAASSASARPT